MKPVSNEIKNRLLRVSKALTILAQRQKEAATPPPPIPEDAKKPAFDVQKAKMKIKQFILDKKTALEKAVTQLEDALMGKDDKMLAPAIMAIRGLAEQLGKVKFVPKQASTKAAISELSSELKYASALVKVAEAEVKKQK